MSQPFADALNWVPKSRALAATLSRAHDLARAHGHATVGLEHLLLSLIEDPDAANVLMVSSIDLDALSGDVAHHLTTLAAEEGANPVADDALLSILEYAVAAAQQSRRRDVNGGIVLAAIVGEGKSEAASLLRNHGMTFQAAIEAIKGSARTTTGPPVAPVLVPEPPPPPPPASPEPQDISDAASTATEEILWRARQRVEALQTPVPVITRSVTAPPPMPEAAPDPASAPEPVFAPEPAPEHTLRPHAAAAAVTGLNTLPEPEPPGTPEPMEPVLPARPAPSWLPPTPPDAPAPGRIPGRAPPPMPPLDAEPSSTPPTGPPPLPHATEPANGHGAATTAGDVSWSARPGAPPPLPSSSLKRTKEPAGDDSAAGSNGAAPGRARKKGRGGDRVAPAAMLPDVRTFEAIADRLAHSIPRRIRAGRPAEIELRLQQSEVDALLGERAIPGSAIALRLRMMSGPGHVEAITPETQWLAPVSAKQDRSLAWRWSIVPHRRGLLRLELAGTVRIVSSNGGAAETDLPEQGMEARAGLNLLNAGGKALAVGGFTVAGAVLDDHAEPLIEAALKALAKLTGG